ncbi:hypothetical protein DH2020_007257 [Rehmannia glutinosa]|uniref:Bidirectional sugar transporter SWEET n=1 Tax=Rehmannia glutinosa TaxID=99300 RepID=A0ABR0TXP0_REHGL
MIAQREYATQPDPSLGRSCAVPLHFNGLATPLYGMPFVSPNNLLISTVNGTGAAIQSVFVIIFLIYAPRKEKGKILGLLTIVLTIFATVVFVSLFAFHGHDRKLFCGVITTSVAIVMYGSPLTIIRLVIKTKSVEYMPFFLSLFVFLCATSWIIFGILEKDPFIAIPSGFGCVLGTVQLTLYAIYRKNKGENKRITADDESLEMEKTMRIIIRNTTAESGSLFKDFQAASKSCTS